MVVCGSFTFGRRVGLLLICRCVARVTWIPEFVSTFKGSFETLQLSNSCLSRSSVSIYNRVRRIMTRLFLEPLCFFMKTSFVGQMPLGGRRLMKSVMGLLGSRRRRLLGGM